MDHGHRVATGGPPTALQYDLFTPVNKRAKTTTYVRKGIGLAPHTIATYQDCILSLVVTINELPKEIINMYLPTKTESPAFLATHPPMTDYFVTGDFNAHHLDWYGVRRRIRRSYPREQTNYRALGTMGHALQLGTSQ